MSVSCKTSDGGVRALGGLLTLLLALCSSSFTRASEPAGLGALVVIGEKRDAVLPGPAGLNIAERAACSTLSQAKQPTGKAFRTISDLGYKWLDLSCLSWAPHVSVPALLKDFDQEASRVESLLAANGLKTGNLTYDSFDGRPLDQYQKEIEALAKLAARLKARLINIMAPSNQADRQEVADKLKKLVAAASKEGILLTLETHCNQITERPGDALWLCQQVPGLGLTLDPSHYYAGPNQGKAFDLLYSYVQGTGFRAGGMSWAEIQMPWGQGPIDFGAVVKKLTAAGYKGFFASEYIEGFNKVDAVAEARKYLQWTKGR